MIGSTILGVALVRSRYKPRVTAWLLALVLPSMLVLPTFLGNLSLGLLTVFVAWAASGWRLCRAEPPSQPWNAGATQEPSPTPERESTLAARS